MKNWKNAEVIELDINETADGRWPALREIEPHTTIGYWEYGGHSVIGSQNNGQTQTQPGQQPTAESDLSGTPSTERIS